jgi:hypothetical protein
MVMKTIHTNAKYTEWLSAENMHDRSKKWLSQLQFYKDEIRFFENLIATLTLQILDSRHFEESKNLVEKLTKITKDNDILIDAVKAHEQKLDLLVDGINQITEEANYRNNHRNLVELIGEFQNKYRTLKTALFAFTTQIMKKQKHLIAKT